MLLEDSRYLAAVFIKKILGYSAVAYFVRVLDKVRSALIINLLIMVAANKNAQVVHIRQLIWRYQGVRCTSLASTRCTA